MMHPVLHLSKSRTGALRSRGCAHLCNPGFETLVKLVVVVPSRFETLVKLVVVVPSRFEMLVKLVVVVV
jgi:hypothetical protein